MLEYMSWNENKIHGTNSPCSLYKGTMSPCNCSSLIKRNQIWEPCAQSIACMLIHLWESCERVAVHLRHTCDTCKIHLRDLAPVAWPAYTCVQPAHHLRRASPFSLGIICNQLACRGSALAVMTTSVILIPSYAMLPCAFLPCVQPTINISRRRMIFADKMA